MNKTFFVAVLSIVLLNGLSAFAQSKAYSEAEVILESDKFDMGCNQLATKIVQKIDFKFVYDYEAATGPERTATYYIVTCVAGAYNESSVLLRASDLSDKLQPVSFAAPEVNSAGKMIGFTANVVTGALVYDEASKSLLTYSKGRGIGDLYRSGIYELHEEQVILRSYTIDNQDGDNKVAPIFENTETLP